MFIYHYKPNTNNPKLFKLKVIVWLSSFNIDYFTPRPQMKKTILHGPKFIILTYPDMKVYFAFRDGRFLNIKSKLKDETNCKFCYCGERDLHFTNLLRVTEFAYSYYEFVSRMGWLCFVIIFIT